MYKKISLIIVEYPDGRIAVQPCTESKIIFDNCSKVSGDIVGARMTRVDVEYGDNKIDTVSEAKIIDKAFPNDKTKRSVL